MTWKLTKWYCKLYWNTSGEGNSLKRLLFKGSLFPSLLYALIHSDRYKTYKATERDGGTETVLTSKTFPEFANVKMAKKNILRF